MSLKTTGRRRYRTAVTGCFRKRVVLVLQIEIAGTEPMFLCGHVSMTDVVRWRDANITDLTTTEEVEA